MKSKQSYRNETRNGIRILCEKIKYKGDLIGGLMDDTEGEVQKKYLQIEIEKHRLDLLKIAIKGQYEVIENEPTKNI